MGDQNDGCEEARQREAVAHFLHEHARGAQRGRGHVRTAVVVDDDADGDVQGCHDELAEGQGFEVLLVVFHLRDDVEVRGCAGVSKDQRGQSRGGLSKRRRLEELEVGFPWPELGRG